MLVKGIYDSRKNEMHKAYIVLFTCSVSREILFDLVEDNTSKNFINNIKKFIARRGCWSSCRPSKYSQYHTDQKHLRKTCKSCKSLGRGAAVINVCHVEMIGEDLVPRYRWRLGIAVELI